jgi:hypothetical protein
MIKKYLKVIEIPEVVGLTKGIHTYYEARLSIHFNEETKEYFYDNDYFDKIDIADKVRETELK